MSGCGVSGEGGVRDGEARDVFEVDGPAAIPSSDVRLNATADNGQREVAGGFDGPTLLDFVAPENAACQGDRGSAAAREVDQPATVGYADAQPAPSKSSLCKNRTAVTGT